MRSRVGVAIVQSLALAAALVVWCPCAEPAAPSAPDPHACCHEGRTTVRSTVDPHCVHCNVAANPTRSEAASPKVTMGAPGPAATLPVVADLPPAATPFRLALPSASPPSRSAPTPLRI